MGITYNSSIVRSGLVLYLDAANSKSYPKTGTTWTDLSGNGNNGTLTNGPVFNSSNNGNIIFDGVDDYAVINHSTILNPGSGSISFSCFCKVNSDVPADYFPSLLYKSDGDWRNGYLIRSSWPYNGTFVVGVSQGQNTGVDRITVISTSTTSLGNWVNITGVWESSNRTLSLYFNGRLDATGTTTNTLIVDPTANLELCRINRLSRGRFEYVNSNISQVQIYNRAISASEVRQNFEASRDRYGI